MFKKWTQWVNFIEKATISFTAVLMGLMAIFISYQVFSRYVLRFSPYWTEEIACTTMMWAGLLGAACATWTDSHMKLEMVVKHFSKSLQLWLQVFSDCLIIGFAGYMVFEGVRLVQMLMNGVMSSVPVEIGYTYLVVPISGGLMIVFGLTKAIDRIFKFYVLKEFTTSEGVGMHG